MTEFLAPRNNFHGQTVFPPTAQVNLSGELTVGDPDITAILGSDVWELARPIVRVANMTERAAYLAFFEETFGPASVVNPCIVWRADGATGGALQAFDGVNWAALSPHAGDIQLTIRSTAPHGWAMCDGQTLTNAQTNYPELWSNANPSWRSGSNLILPDMRGRVPVGHGQGPGLTNRTTGQKGGAEKVKLAQSETPLKKHMHGGFDWRSAIRSFISASKRDIWLEAGNGIAGNSHSYWGDRMPTDQPGQKPVQRGMPAAPSSTVQPGDAPANPPLGYGNWGTKETESDSATPHENMQPFVVVNYKIKL